VHSSQQLHTDTNFTHKIHRTEQYITSKLTGSQEYKMMAKKKKIVMMMTQMSQFNRQTLSISLKSQKSGILGIPGQYFEYKSFL
jgi:hypothetical protein